MILLYYIPYTNVHPKDLQRVGKRRREHLKKKLDHRYTLTVIKNQLKTLLPRSWIEYFLNLPTLTWIVGQIGLIVILVSTLAIRLPAYTIAMLVEGIIVDVIRSTWCHNSGSIFFDDALDFLLEYFEYVGRALELKRWTKIEWNVVEISAGEGYGIHCSTHPHLALDKVLRGYHKVYGTCHGFQCAVLQLLDLIRFDVMWRHLQKEASWNGSGSSVASNLVVRFEINLKIFIKSFCIFRIALAGDINGELSVATAYRVPHTMHNAQVATLEWMLCLIRGLPAGKEQPAPTSRALRYLGPLLTPSWPPKNIPQQANL